MGYDVAVLDPFNITSFESARLNPLDQFDLPGAMLESDAEMLASQLGEEHVIEKDLFWNDQANSLIAALIVAILKTEAPHDRDLVTLKDYLFGDDVTYQLAVLLDNKGKQMPKFAYNGIAAFLQAADQNTRPSILNCAPELHASRFCSESVELCAGGLDHQACRRHRRGSRDIFVFASRHDKIKSHKCLVKLWVGTLLTAIMRPESDRYPPSERCWSSTRPHNLGEFDLVLTACTLLRGYGLQLITAWQDLAPDPQSVQAGLPRRS